MSDKTMLVVADVYDLSRIGKKFNDDESKGTLKFKGHLVERAYAKEMNDHWQVRGKRYIIDEDASIEAQEEREIKAAKRLERDEARELAGRAVASMALGINSAPKEGEPEGSMKHTVNELRAMDDLKEMSDEELDEFFKTETRATGKALLGELITGNN